MVGTCMSWSLMTMVTSLGLLERGRMKVVFVANYKLRGG